MTQNKEAIEALDVMYEALKEYTGDANPLPNTREYIRTTLQEPEVDVESLKLECCGIAQKDISREGIVLQVIDHLHKRGIIRGAGDETVYKIDKHKFIQHVDAVIAYHSGIEGDEEFVENYRKDVDILIGNTPPKGQKQ